MFLKRRFKHWIISSYFRNFFLKLLINFNNNNYIKLNTKKNKLFDWKLYKHKIKPYFFHPVIDNNFYGIGTSLNLYCGLKKNNLIKYYIEHGYFFGSYVAEDSKKYWCKSIITFSERRANYLKPYNFNKIYQIGPYIHYAQKYSSPSEFKKYKSELGKMLLVFPMHSSTGTYLDFDVNLFFDFIDKTKKDYDSVVISVFWTDLNNEKFINECLFRKYKIFSAGNRYDQFFLSRLKDIINLSDMTISNGVGTHLIYSVYLKKPHFIFKQKTQEKSNNKKGDFELSIYSNDEYEIRKNEMNELEFLFGNSFNDKLSPKQYAYCESNFGFDKIKTPKQILKIVYE
jgi:hypothetical protein